MNGMGRSDPSGVAASGEGVYRLRRRRHAGATLVESLVALPVVLLFGLMLVQLALIYQAKHLLDHALMEGVREAALDHASPAALEAGIARGLAPTLMRQDGLAGYVRARAEARLHLEQGMTMRWIQLRQLSPFDGSFLDWEEAALDAAGRPLPGIREIPNDNLDSRRWTAPARGVSAVRRSSDPIGPVSSQTLADANLLRVQMTYGVPLKVPFAGPLLRLAMMTTRGCLGRQALAAADECAMLIVHGRAPVTAEATTRMMSPARRSRLTQQPQGVPTGSKGIGSGAGEHSETVSY